MARMRAASIFPMSQIYVFSWKFISLTSERVYILACDVAKGVPVYDARLRRAAIMDGASVVLSRASAEQKWHS